MFYKIREFLVNFFGGDDVAREDATICSDDVDLGEEVGAPAFSGRNMMPDSDVVFSQYESKIDGPFFWPEGDCDSTEDKFWDFGMHSESDLLSLTNAELHELADLVGAKVLVKDTKAKLVQKIMAVVNIA